VWRVTNVALLVTASSDRLRVQDPTATNDSLSHTTVCSATWALEVRLERQRFGARGLVHTLKTAILSTVRGTHVLQSSVSVTGTGCSGGHGEMD